MGYVKHNAIVVTGWNAEKVNEARLKAIEIFERCFNDEPMVKPYVGKLISEVVYGLTNNQCSFFIAPDGSKEGWQTSDNGDKARDEFCDWLNREPDNFSDYVEIVFGGDDSNEKIVRSKDTYLDGL
jgi:hypothetical protein